MAPAQPPPDWADVVKRIVEESTGDIAEERRQLALARMDLVDKQQEEKSWWKEWTKPTILLAVLGVFGAQFVAYQNDRATISASLLTLKSDIESLRMQVLADEKQTNDRTIKYIPAIEQVQSDNATQNVRIQNIINTQAALTDSVNKLADAVARVHEELAVDRAKQSRAEEKAVRDAQAIH